jgi:hypothetical protein
MEHGNQIRPIVHGEDRRMIQSGPEMAIVGLAVLPIDGKDRYLVVFDQGSSHIVLGGKRVGGTENDLCTSRL